MQRLKIYLFSNFEPLVVLAILLSMLFIHYLVEQKIAFLNFYYLPVLFAGYFLGRRPAVLASVFCILLVTIFFLTTPHLFTPLKGTLPLVLSLTLWGSFLTLTSYVTGTLFQLKEKSIQDLRHAYVGVLEILSKYLESTDRYTKGHCTRVATLATEIAIAMELPRHEIENIKAAALLHDIGKVDVSMDLIQNASRVSREGKKEVDIHTEKGAHLLKSVGDVLKEAVPIVLSHHRFFKDLEGDPSVIKEAKTGAYIIAISDTYDAIVTDHPYRAGKTPAAALEEIEKEAGKQFHPEVVKVFKRIFAPKLSAFENKIIPFTV